MSDDTKAATTSTVVHEAKLPNGYRWNMASSAPQPVFDRGGRTIWLRFHADGTVTWQLRNMHDEVLEPSENGSSGGES